MKKTHSLLQIITNWILISVVSAFVLSTIGVYVSTTILSREKSEQLLANNIEDLRSELHEADSIIFSSGAMTSANNVQNSVLDVCKTQRQLYDAFVFSAEQSQVQELFYVDSTGVIRVANIPSFVGFDMHSTEMARPFLKLIKENPKTIDDSVYITPLYPKGLMGGKPCKYMAARMPSRKGFIVIGLQEERVVAQMNFMLSGSAHYRRVGERGRLYIFDSKLNIVSAPFTCKAKTMEEVGISKNDLEKMPEQTLFEATILEEPSLCYHSYLAGYHMLAVQPCSESTFNRDAALRSRTVTGSLVFVILFFIIWYMVRRLVGYLNRVNASLEKITSGDLNERVSVDDTIEFKQLSERTNQMVDRLKDYIKEAENRVAEDLVLAKAIQSSTLPSVFPAFPDHQEFDIHALMKTARQVGGDFYDFFFVGENKLAIVMADVAGKGIPAAMFMMRSKSAVKNHASTGLPLAQVCYDVNNLLCQSNDTQTFFTCWIGVIDLKSGLLTYVNAGHNLPLVRHKGGNYDYIECLPNLPMAAFEDFAFKEETIQLQPGDEIFLYTDGVTEATSTALELFGDERLLDVMNTMPEEASATSRTICLRVLQTVQDFARGAEQSDDITMLSFKYFG